MAAPEMLRAAQQVILAVAGTYCPAPGLFQAQHNITPLPVHDPSLQVATQQLHVDACAGGLLSSCTVAAFICGPSAGSCLFWLIDSIPGSAAAILRKSACSTHCTHRHVSRQDM